MDQLPCTTNSGTLFPIPVVFRHYSGEHVGQLNQRLEQLIRNIDAENRAAKTTATQGGYHTGPDFLSRNDEEVVELCNKVIYSGIVEYLRYYYNLMGIANENANSDKIEMRGWANIMGPGEWNAPHNHITAHNRISAVYYIRIPDRPFPEGALQFDNPNQISKLHGSYGDMIFMPKVGDLILFPSYQVHYSHPFKSDEERILVASDIRVHDRLDEIQLNNHPSITLQTRA